MTYFYSYYNYIWGSHGDDTIHGTHGNDVIFGKDGNDVIYAGYGRDVIYAGAGDDKIYGGFGNDYISGGEGNDTVSWEHWGKGLYADLSSQRVYFYKGGGAEYMHSIENMDGSQGNDILKGNNIANVINGLNGNDRIFGRGGNDTLRGQAGHDRLYGGSGNDKLNGGEGNDRSYGGSGNDRIIGGQGNDKINGGSGFDIADYGHLDNAITYQTNGIVHKGDGSCDVLTSIEIIVGTEGKVNTFDASREGAGIAIDLDLAQNLVTIENAALNNPTFEIYNFVDVVGTDENDTLRGDEQNNELIGGRGMDELYGAEGDDRIDGGLGDDWLFGGLGDDTIFGREGNDSLLGDGGNDLLIALQGNDVLNGTNAELAGAFERDTLIGGTDGDRFILGDAHRAYYATNGGQDFAVVRDFQVGSDVIVLHGSAAEYELKLRDGNTDILIGGDRIASIQDIVEIELTSSSFKFVS
ncbi:MAG: calcium-binding protein [Cyanobacteria bacterium J06621_11]